jgi:hypothetical protein
LTDNNRAICAGSGLQGRAVRPRDLLKLGRTGQAAGVAEQVPDRDGANRWLQQDVRLVFFFDDHPLAELRNELGHGVDHFFSFQVTP